jgi:hypothetical protein
MLYTGYIFLRNSSIAEEQHFVSVLFHRANDTSQDENRELAKYIDNLPKEAHVLVDDAIGFPIVSFSKETKELSAKENLQKFTLPYQNSYLGAIEAPDKFDEYILLATPKNEVTGFTQLNDRYVPVIKKANSALKLRRIYETNDWILYKVLVD